MAAKANTNFGHTPDFVVCDELTHWTDKKFWTSLRSGLHKVPTACLIIISNAGEGKGRSWQWKIRERCRESSAWYFKSLPGSVASWLTSEGIEEQRQELDDRDFRRLILNKWLSDQRDGIPDIEVQDATRMTGPPAKFDRYQAIIGGLDIGIRKDRTSLVLLGVQTKNKRLELVSHHTWKPSDFPDGRVNLGAVESVILQEHRRVGKIRALYADDWQAVRTMEILGGKIRCEGVDFGSSKVRLDMAKKFTDSFRSGWLHLFHDEILETDILSIEVQHTPVSHTKTLVADRDENGHADSGFALAIAVWKGFYWLEELSRPDIEAETTFATIGDYLL